MTTAPWFSLCQWSLAGYDAVYGETNWKRLEDGMVAEIGRIGSDVFGLTELPGPRVAAMRAKLGRIGYRIVANTDGRTILVGNQVAVIRTRKVTLAERGPAKDDKQVVMAQLAIRGSQLVVGVGHLEFREGSRYDSTRVKQAKQERAAVLAFAAEGRVAEPRVLFADDENSKTWVLAEAYEPTFVDAFSRATKTTNEATATICGWSGKTRKGDRTDKIKVHKSRPVLSATVRTSTAKLQLSDHLPTQIVVG